MHNTGKTKSTSAMQLLRERRLCTLTDTDDEIVYQPAAAVSKLMEQYAKLKIDECKMQAWSESGIPPDEKQLSHLAMEVMKRNHLACSAFMIKAFVIGMRHAAEINSLKEVRD